MVSKVFTKEELDDLIDLEAATRMKKPEKAKFTTSDNPPQIHRANVSFSEKFKPQQHIPSARLERCPPPRFSRGQMSGTFKENDVRDRIPQPHQQNGTQAKNSIDVFGYSPEPKQASTQSDWIPNFLKPSRSAEKASMLKGLQLGRSNESPDMHSPTPEHVGASGDNGKPKIQDFRDTYNDEFDIQDPWEVDISDADLR